MPYVSSVERNGIKKGIEQGQRKSWLGSIALDLDAKFGPTGFKLLRQVRRLETVAELRKFARFLKTATNVDEVREYLK
jgi:hypothetical protein